MCFLFVNYYVIIGGFLAIFKVINRKVPVKTFILQTTNFFGVLLFWPFMVGVSFVVPFYQKVFPPKMKNISTQTELTASWSPDDRSLSARSIWGGRLDTSVNSTGHTHLLNESSASNQSSINFPLRDSARRSRPSIFFGDSGNGTYVPTSTPRFRSILVSNQNV